MDYYLLFIFILFIKKFLINFFINKIFLQYILIEFVSLIPLSIRCAMCLWRWPKLNCINNNNYDGCIPHVVIHFMST